MNTYKLYQYELWGNDEDGYEVNDMFYVDSYEIPTDATESEILKIIEARKGVKIDNNSLEAIYFLDKNQNPVGELRLA